MKNQASVKECLGCCRFLSDNNLYFVDIVYLHREELDKES